MPKEGQTGMLVALSVPQTASVQVWQGTVDSPRRMHPGKAGGSGTEEDAFVRVPRGLKGGEKFHFFRDGRPFELMVPEGAGGGAVIRLPKSSLAPPEGWTPTAEDFGRED